MLLECIALEKRFLQVNRPSQALLKINIVLLYKHNIDYCA